jgi:hypothetical protein
MAALVRSPIFTDHPLVYQLGHQPINLSPMSVLVTLPGIVQKIAKVHNAPFLLLKIIPSESYPFGHIAINISLT